MLKGTLVHHHVTRRTRISVAVAFAAIPLIAGCSATVSGPTAAGNALQPTAGAPSAKPTQNAAGSSARVLPATLDLSATSAQAQTERFLRIKTSIKASFGSVSPTTTATTTVDTSTGDLEVTGSLGTDKSGLSASGYTVRKIGSVIYVRLGADSKWMKMDVGSAGVGILPIPTTGKSLLDEFESMGITFSKQGTVTRDSERLTKYVGTFDLADLVAKMKGDFPGAANWLASGADNAQLKASATILVTAKGAPRHVEYSADVAGDDGAGSLSMTADYEKVTGTPDITAPPASQVTEFGAGLGQALSGGN